MNNDTKKVGYTIALISLAIRILTFLIFLGSIIEWWGAAVIIPICLSFTHFATIKSAKSRNSVSVPLSIVMIVISVIFLLADGFMFLGFVISLNSTPLMAMGMTPICNVLNIVANISILIESAVKKSPRVYFPDNQYVDYEEIPDPSLDEVISGLQHVDSINTSVQDDTDDYSDDRLTFAKAREIFGGTDK